MNFAIDKDFQKIDNIRSIYNKIVNTYPIFMELKVFVNSDDEELKKRYVEATVKHNNQYLETRYPNSGFDLLIPNEISVRSENDSDVIKIDHQIKCCSTIVYCGVAALTSQVKTPCSYYLYPRSSISKTPLRLANNVGIIDSGYRGNLIAVVDVKSKNLQDTFVVEKYNRLFQICSPELVPIIVTIVDNANDLGEYTERGQGGFGSTGV